MRAAVLAVGLAACTARAAPDFMLPTLDGGSLRLADLRGRAVVVSFFAPWCAPCKLEAPWLVDLDRRHRDEGLTVVGVAVDSEAAAVARFAAEHRLAYPIVLGDAAVAEAYGGLRLLPETVVVGRDGAVVERSVGLGSPAELEAGVRRALGPQSP